MIRIPAIRLFLLCTSLALGGCASVHNNPKDPFESYNRAMYQINDAVDKAVVKPAAKGYNAILPEPGRMMLSNFFSNLDDVVVTVNDLLELKVIQAAADAGRFVVNTTVGLYGLADVASAVGLEKHNKDFGQTLGYWGVGNGPYLVLPLLGPSSVRDGIGLYVDTRTSLLQKVKYVDTRNEAWATNLVGRRASLLGSERMLEEAAPDRYAFIRDAYLQRRQSLIDEGKPTRRKYDDEEYDDKGDDSKPTGKDSSNRSANDSEVQSALAAPLPPVVPPATAGGQGEATIPQRPTVYRIWTSQVAAP